MVKCSAPFCYNATYRKDPEITFHRFPKERMLCDIWVANMNRKDFKPKNSSVLCSKHFEERFIESSLFRACLRPGAKPTLFGTLESSEPAEIMLHAETSTDLLACRVCLAVDGRLLPISGSGFEDTFEELTGVKLSKKGFPRHLCAFCRAKLSKCAAFRDSCQRSTALLQTLLERGPLQIEDIRAIDRKTHKLTDSIVREKVFHFPTHPFLQIPPIKMEDETAEANDGFNYVGANYLRIDDRNIMDAKSCTDGNGIQMKAEFVKSDDDYSTEETERADAETVTDTNHLEIENVSIVPMERVEVQIEFEKEPTKDTVKSECGINKTKETKKVKAGKTVHFASDRNKKKVIGDDVYPMFNYAAFEKQFDVRIKFLSKEEQRQEIEEKKRNNKSNYCCDMCGKGFGSEKTMKNHLVFHHTNGGPVECEICRCRFRAETEFRWRRHRDAHRLAFICRACGFLSRDKSNAKTHSLVHTGKTYACRHCGQAYKHRTSYLTHMRQRHPAQNQACDQCGETFLSENGVRQHKAKAHPNIKPQSDFKCTDCEVKFLSAEALLKHTELSAGSAHAALWPCASCGDSCGSEAGLAAHAQDIHPPDQHHCDECNVTFSSAASFALHSRRKHLGVTGYGARRNRPPRPRGSGPAPRVVCEVCGRIIQNEAALKFHLYTHMDLKPYACPVCPKTFAGKTAREYHMRSHTGERPFQCEHCPLACALKGTLVRHMERVHLNKPRRMYPCEICNKTFTERAGVKLHVRTVHNHMPAPKRARKPKNAD